MDWLPCSGSKPPTGPTVPLLAVDGDDSRLHRRHRRPGNAPAAAAAGQALDPAGDADAEMGDLAAVAHYFPDAALRPAVAAAHRGAAEIRQEHRRSRPEGRARDAAPRRVKDQTRAASRAPGSQAAARRSGASRPSARPVRLSLTTLPIVSISCQGVRAMRLPGSPGPPA